MEKEKRIKVEAEVTTAKNVSSGIGKGVGNLCLGHLLIFVLFITACQIVVAPVDEQTEIAIMNEQLFEEAENAEIGETIKVPITWEYDYLNYYGSPILCTEYSHKDFQLGGHGYGILIVVPKTETIIKNDSKSYVYMRDYTDTNQPPSGTKKFCVLPLIFKHAGLDGKEVYVIANTGYSFLFNDNLVGKHINEIRNMEDAKVYESFVPPIDEKGFVPIEYVNEIWCNYYVSKQYPDKCREFIEQMKNPDCSVSKFEYVCDYLRQLDILKVREIVKAKQITSYNECVQELGKDKENLCTDVIR